MKTRSVLTKILTVAASVLMLAAVGSGNAYASFVSEFPELSEITLDAFPDFGYTVKVKISQQGQSGFKLIVRGTGGGNYLTLPGSENLEIKGGGYKLDAMFDPFGNFLEGTLQITGKLDTDAGKAAGILVTASLGSGEAAGTFTTASSGSGPGGVDFVYTSTMFAFNTHDVDCNPVIDALVGGCTSNEFVYIELAEGGFAPTVKNFMSDGIASVAAVPVPAAVWLFGSGLIGLVGIARRRKY
jgi:hypothetical protein